MELNLFSFIIFSLTTLTIRSNFVDTSALNYDKEVIESDPTVKRNTTEVKEPDFEQPDYNSMQVKFPTHEGIVTSDRKDTDELPGDVVNPTLCSPSPCGPNSQCRGVNSQAICSCQNDFMGTPPNCRPECTDNSECSSDKACLNRKCVDPCINQCARNANCTVIAHNAVCSCQDRFTGDAFTSCVPVPEPISTQLPEVDPCKPTRCREKFWHWCEEFNGTARCACLQNDFKSPPICIPECTTDSECNEDMACIYNRCIDSCPAGACGYNAQCHVINHLPHCLIELYIGESTLCSPSPCGPNSQCRELEQQAVCRCQKHFIGRPPHCGLECTNSSECASGKACRNHECVVDPCVNQCAGNGNCRAIAHNGVPLPLSISMQRPEVDPCTPSPCGPNSQCQAYNGNACCTCLPHYIGSPPRCRPECTISSECHSYMTCINNQCSNPCLWACGNHTECIVYDHVPYCSCFSDYLGDPFTGCYHERNETDSELPEWIKKAGWYSDLCPSCYVSGVLDSFRVRECPPGTERFNDICVEIDE